PTTCGQGTWRCPKGRRFASRPFQALTCCVLPVAKDRSYHVQDLLVLHLAPLVVRVGVHHFSGLPAGKTCVEHLGKRNRLPERWAVVQLFHRRGVAQAPCKLYGVLDVAHPAVVHVHMPLYYL